MDRMQEYTTKWAKFLQMVLGFVSNILAKVGQPDVGDLLVEIGDGAVEVNKLLWE